jgi:hypothetical protein
MAKAGLGTKALWKNKFVRYLEVTSFGSEWLSHIVDFDPKKSGIGLENTYNWTFFP